MRGQVVNRPSLVLNIIMRHCGPCWHGCRCFPLPSVFLWGQLDDELFFCSLAQHDTFNSPDGPHHDSVSRLVCCWAACTGQWNIITAVELGLTRWKISSSKAARSWVVFFGFCLFFLPRCVNYKTWCDHESHGAEWLNRDGDGCLCGLMFLTAPLYSIKRWKWLITPWTNDKNSKLMRD